MLSSKQSPNDLTENQIEECREIFNIYDLDGDGIITLKEMEKILKTFNYSSSPKAVQKMTAKFDDNQNGTIEFKEFLALIMELTRTQSDTNELQKVFQMFDRDHDGFLTSADLRYALHTLGEKLNDTEAEMMLKLGDFDHDGKISFEDFQKF